MRAAGMVEVWTANSPSQRRGAQVPGQVQSRMGRSSLRLLHYPELGARKTPLKARSELREVSGERGTDGAGTADSASHPWRG